jgi:hypothetical protein
MIYLLTAIGQPPGGSCSVHIYTQTIQGTSQNKQYIEQHKKYIDHHKKCIEQQKNQEECGPCPVFAGITLAFVLQLRNFPCPLTAIRFVQRTHAWDIMHGMNIKIQDSNIQSPKSHLYKQGRIRVAFTYAVTTPFLAPLYKMSERCLPAPFGFGGGGTAFSHQTLLLLLQESRPHSDWLSQDDCWGAHWRAFTQCGLSFCTVSFLSFYKVFNLRVDLF